MLAPRADRLRQVRPAWAMVIRSFAFVRKEIVEIVRQPRLVLLLVVGPFVLLLCFGSGYAETDYERRAIFVGASDSIYGEVVEIYDDNLSDFIDSQGIVPTEAEGRSALEAGDVDVVVIFPDDPASSVMAGDRATIEILHDEIDPIQLGAIEVASRLAVQEVNATVLAALGTEVQDGSGSAGGLSDELLTAADSLADDPIETRESLRESLSNVDDVLGGSAAALERIGPTDSADLDQLRETIELASRIGDRLDSVDEQTSDDELRELSDATRSLAAELDGPVVIDPNVLVRPFQSDIENVEGDDIGPTDYFTPASLALLLQHLALTFAALSIVRDRRTGLFELMRVGPLASIEIIVGKILAYLLVGITVAAALVAAAAFTLEMTVSGSLTWLVVVVLGVLVASLALGMVLALISRSESQAVQYAMLALLAGLFFSGFILPLDTLTYPVRVISWLLPVTYGIDALQDVMLRGVAPASGTLAGLGALVVAFGTAAVFGLRRQLQTSDV